MAISIIIFAVAGLIIGGVVGYFGVNASMKAKVTRKLKEAEDQGENMKRNKLLEAKEKFLNEYFCLYAQDRTPDEYDIYADEVPVEKVIEDEQRMLRQRLISKYAAENFGDMSVREFNQMMRRDDKVEQNQMFYKALSEHLKRIRMTEYLENRLETDKLSHAEFCEIRNALCSAKIGEEFEKINLAATAKYGKETND